ncbi:MAG: hypothetical protein JWM73_1227 [Solirubrobacterales bacterium]|nr:hypothetical protein [Solirubrobacterales bacterium]
MRRHSLPVLALLAIATGGLALGASPASARLQVGISEQNANMFVNRYFKPLKVKYARIVVPWNIMSRKDYWPGYLKAWLAGAKRTNVQPHVAFNIAGIEPKYFGKGPTPKQYRAMFKKFHKKYPQVRVFTPWNEENHSFQPTAKHPKLAYDYYRAVKQGCPKCTVLAADVLDDANLTSWLRKYKRYHKGTGTWGIHNYQDANKHRSFKTSWTYKMARSVKGQIWSTEAGGLVGFKTTKGRVAYKYSLSRQLKAQRYLFTLMRNPKVRKRYQRVYMYNFFGTWTKTRKTNRWDSGLLSLAGKPRPAYTDLKKQIKRG